LAPRRGGSDCSGLRGWLPAGKQQPSRCLVQARPGVQRRPGEAAGVRGGHTQRLLAVSPRDDTGGAARLYVPTQTTCWPSRSALIAACMLPTPQCCVPTCGADAVTQGSSSRLQAARISPSPSPAGIPPRLLGPGDSGERAACRAARCPSTQCEPRGHGGFGAPATPRRWAICLHGGQLVSVYIAVSVRGHMYIRDNGDASGVSWLAMMRFRANVGLRRIVT
jgi:hypothetical protein